MKGHVKLGTSVGGLREYMLTDPNALGMQLSNQMAAKLGMGGGKYDDLQNWSAWVMDNWSAGAGTVDAEGGGFLFGDVESRVPRQLILPPAQGVVDTAAFNSAYRLLPADLTEFGVSNSSLDSGEEVIWSVTAKANGAISKALWLYADIPFGSTITVKLYSSGGSLLQTDTYTSLIKDMGYRWHTLGTTYNVVAATNYSFRVSVNASWNVIISDQYSTPFFIFQNGGSNSPYITKVTRFNSALYGIGGSTSAVYKYNTSTKLWAAVAGSPTGALDITEWNSKLYIGMGSGNFYTMNTSEAFTAGATTGKHWYKWNGYLYRVVNDSLYYTADGTTWSGPFVAQPGQNILAMAGMGNDVYFSDLTALHRFAPGDQMFGVMQWGKTAGNIGKVTASASFPTDIGMPGMVNFQGDIYVAVDGQIVRYTSAGQVSEIWLKDSGDLPYLYTGRICALTTMNNYLVVAVAQNNGHSVWAWNKQGWHCIGILTTGNANYPGVYSMYFDRTLNRLWVNHFNYCFFLQISDLIQNPYTLTEYATSPLFMPSAWMETHWFDGNLFEVRKDFESVYVTGDSIGSVNSGDTAIDVYWMDDDSTSWELLGTVDADRTELRWSDVSTRPNSRQIKIALRLRTEGLTSTPKVEAVRVKYMSMLLDRYRWTLPIALAANQEMLDGSENSYTLAQQVAHIESLIESVAPIWFEDVTGTQYEVKVLGASRSVRDFEYHRVSSVKVYKLVYNIVIEQVVSNINT